MHSLIRPRLFAGAALLLLVLAVAPEQLGSAKADEQTERPAGSGAESLILGSKDDAQPENIEQFLTAVTKDVDAYWTKEFKDSGLPEPKVSYTWIPAGQTAGSACGDEDGTLDNALPGSSQGYGKTMGDFAVAYIVAHEYGHQIQDELGLFEKYGDQLPTMAFELQADCFAGTWAQSAQQEDRLEAVSYTHLTLPTKA